MNSIYLFALLGIFVVVLFQIWRLQKATPNLSLVNTVKQYFHINLLPLVIGIILVVILLYLAQTGDLNLFQYFGLDVIEKSNGAGFTAGFLSQYIVNVVGSKVPQVETEGDKVVTS